MIGGRADDKHSVIGSGFKHLMSVEDALLLLRENISVIVPIDSVKHEEALGRILGEDLVSPVDMPPLDRAAMDGFGVIAEDTYGASATAPVFLNRVSFASTTSIQRAELHTEQAFYVATGEPLPQGCTAIVLVEHARILDDNMVEIAEEVHPGENVSSKGEDVKKGSIVLKKGTRLLPQDIGMLAYLGISNVPVYRKPRVAVLSTGNEIRDIASADSGKMPDVNRPVIMAALTELGCEPIDLGVSLDEPEEIRGRLEKGLSTADAVIVSGGTSVGKADHVPTVINALGMPGMLVHGVAMRPSMPTGLAAVNGKPVISLPGYPVSAYLAFMEFFPPIVNQLLGTASTAKTVIKARLRRRIAGVLGSRTYVRVVVSSTKEGFAVDPVSTSGAGILSSLVGANGLVVIPENVEGFEEGALVAVQMLRPPERAPDVQ